MSPESRERLSDRLARRRIADRSVRIYGLPAQRNPGACCLDYVRVDVTEHVAQRIVGVCPPVGAAGPDALIHAIGLR